jgi:hypothetical protein
MPAGGSVFYADTIKAREGNMLNMIIMMLFVMFNADKGTAAEPVEPAIRNTSYATGAGYIESGFIDGGMNRLMN